jgi:hypothetical protein
VGGADQPPEPKEASMKIVGIGRISITPELISEMKAAIAATLRCEAAEIEIEGIEESALASYLKVSSNKGYFHVSDGGGGAWTAWKK